MQSQIKMIHACRFKAAFFLMPLYLHNIQHQSAYEIGLMLLPASMMVALLSPLVGGIVDKHGLKPLLLLGFALLVASAFMQAIFSSHTGTAFILLAFILLGVGWACILSPSISVALSSVPESISGVAMGSLGTLHNFGGAMGLAIGTMVYHYSAKLILLSQVRQPIQTSSAWLDKAIADPENAVRIIQHATGDSFQQARELFQSFFMQGYGGTMELLVGVSLVTLVMIFMIIK